VPRPNWCRVHELRDSQVSDSQGKDQIKVCLDEGVRIFFTSAGSPKKYTAMLKKEGSVVVHVCASAELARKCEDAGVDGVVAEGFEAGGHNGRDEETTLVLLPQVVDSVRIPVIAAGGIACGRSMLAVAALGVHGFQLGSRFAATEESSAHPNFKSRIISLKPGDTMLSLKKLVPVRLVKNLFFNQVQDAELRGASVEELTKLLGKGRAKLGMFEGDLENGELEIGQVASRMKEILPVKELVARLVQEYQEALQSMCEQRNLGREGS
jgi:enoyl-[acyl-carrier protein] reductase II